MEHTKTKKFVNKYFILIVLSSFILLSLGISIVFASNPTVTVTASPNSVSSGGTSVIGWTSTGANYCISTNPQAGTGPTGSFTTPPITSNTTYWIACSNNICTSMFPNNTPNNWVNECSGKTTETDCDSVTGTPFPTEPPMSVCVWAPDPSSQMAQSSVEVTVG
ncbi:MAG: hypothetical protein WCQ47_08860, partial [bacterium]